MSRPYRVAIYARVSKANGHQDPEMQLRELREYVAHRDWTIVREYIDKMTGSKDCHLVNSLAELEALGLTFVSLRDNLDLTTPSGRLMFQIIGAMAEFERSLIQERVKAGLRNAESKGVRLGRPRVLVSESKIEALRASGVSWRAIAKELGVGIGTARRASQSRAKNLCGAISEHGPEVLHV